MTRRAFVCARCGIDAISGLRGRIPRLCQACREKDRPVRVPVDPARVIALTTEALSVLEVEVLQRLAASRITTSAVKLAAEMYGDFDGHVLNQTITYELVQFVLDGLNRAGLIVYRLAPQMVILDDGRTEWIETASIRHGVPVHIRVTEEGFAAIGYTTRAVSVNSRRSYRGEAPLRPGDGTDFRNQPFMAVAFGAIERCGLVEHLTRYPDHSYATPGGF